MIGDIERGDLLAMTQKMGNVFEPGIIEKYPVIGEIKALMESHGALKAMMSGSGPTVFGIFDDREKMEAAAEGSQREPAGEDGFCHRSNESRREYK